MKIDQALTEFWEQRGYDNTTIGVALAGKVGVKSSPKGGMVYSISVVLGFVVGFIGSVVFLWWRSRRSRKAGGVRSKVSPRKY